MKEVNWQEVIRTMVKELVKDKSKERLLAEAKEIRKEMKVDVSAAELKLIRAEEIPDRLFQMKTPRNMPLLSYRYHSPLKNRLHLPRPLNRLRHPHIMLYLLQ